MTPEQRRRLVEALNSDKPLYGFYPHLNPKVEGKTSTIDTDAHLKGLTEGLLSVAPGSGEAMSLRDAWDASGRGAQALGEGRWGDAASAYGDWALGTLGAIPAAGYIARGTKSGAAWMDRNVPAWMNRLLEAVSPKDAGRTLNSGVGPTSGGGLPMDEASRMSRAKEMGYADEPFYRGEATGQPYGGGPAFFSRDEETAAGFARKGGQAAPAEYRLDLNRTFSDAAPMTAADYGRLVEAAAANDPKLAAKLADNIAPGKGVDWFLGFAKHRPDFVVVEAGGAPFLRQLIERQGSGGFADLLKGAGYDAIDTGRDIMKLSGEGIRSKSARFDPAKASSTDIMAGLVGAGLLPAWALSQGVTSHQD